MGKEREGKGLVDGWGRVEFLKMDGHGGLAVATEDCV